MIWPLIILTAFNVVNAFADAVRILGNKPIAHWLNFGLYAVIYSESCFANDLVWYKALFLGLWAYCNRQIFFDILLNLRRGLKWDYVSLDKPPKALTDRIEVALWGYNGRIGVAVYSTLLIITTILIFIL